ncbi:MAG TPA: F0F1 ATP synthase subunit B [Gemmatimonadaceae bacterium]|nr:F0F1 ATP synthase subunit B [Gemmatimonadaceae bacterium]
MRKSTTLIAMQLLLALPVAAQDEPKSNLLKPDAGLMFWTVVIFLLLFAILAWKAYPAILGAVEAREKALNDALESAKKDREAAAAALAEQQKKLEQTREEAQKLIAEGRAAGDKVRVDVIAQAKAEHDAMLERARAEIQAERDRAVLELRREAVELAVRGASKVLEKNLDDAANRKIVYDYLASIPAAKSN